MVNSTLMSAANIGFAAKFIPLLDLCTNDVVKLWRDQTYPRLMLQRFENIGNWFAAAIEESAPVAGRFALVHRGP
jgi:hypothetical protein